MPFSVGSGIEGRSCWKIETRNSISRLIASTPNSASPRNASIAPTRCEGSVGAVTIRRSVVDFTAALMIRDNEKDCPDHPL